MKLSSGDVTFLSKEELIGKRKLKVLKKYGTKTLVSDFSILLGCVIEEDKIGCSGCYYLSTFNEKGYILKASSDGSLLPDLMGVRDIAARPVLLFSKDFFISIKKRKKILNFKKRLIEVEYGEYPQQAVDFSQQVILEKEYQAQRLKLTGRKYTTDSRKVYGKNSNEFKPLQHLEYSYKGKKYIRVVVFTLAEEPITLANGLKVDIDDTVWIEVQPVRYLVDKKSQKLISKDGLYAGVQFNTEVIYDYEASFIKIFNELRFIVECTKEQIAPKEYVLSEKYKKVPANAFNDIKGLEKVILEGVDLEIGEKAFAGFNFFSKQQDGKISISKNRIKDALWEFNINCGELVNLFYDNLSKPIIYIKNKDGNVDLISESNKKFNLCDVKVFNKFRKQKELEKLDDWVILRKKYNSKCPLYLELLSVVKEDLELYKKFFESKANGYDHLLKREWYSSLSNGSKESLMKLFISLGGFLKKGQKDILITIDKLQETYKDEFNDQIYYLFKEVPKGDSHTFGRMDGKDGIFSFNRTILNFFKKHEYQYKSKEFKETIPSVVSHCPKIYQAYRKRLRNLNPNYPLATNPNKNLYEKTKKEGLSVNFVLQWLLNERYIYLDNSELKQKFMQLPQGVTVPKKIALYYEQLLDKEIPKIVEKVKNGQRNRNKYFVNLIDDGWEVQDNNLSGIHYEWAEINKINALTCGEFMQTCFRINDRNEYAFYNCLDNPEDNFLMLYDDEHLAGYCRVRYYPERKGILVDNIELSNYAGDFFTNSQKEGFARRCKKGLLDMAKAMNEIGYPVERIYSKQDRYAEGKILDIWKKEHKTIEQYENINPMKEIRYVSSRKFGNYKTGNIGAQIVIMETEQKELKKVPSR